MAEAPWPPVLAILAGGLGTRLGRLTATLPKVLVPVAGEPFLAHQLRLVRRSGIERVVLCTGHLGEQVAAFVGDGSAFGLTVTCVADGPDLAGTGGAIARALPWLGDPFLVMYGDSYLELPYLAVAEAFRRSGAQAMMTILQNADRWERSNVLFAEGRIRRYSKRRRSPEMRHVDHGLSLFRASLFAGRESPWDLAELLEELAEHGELAGYEVTRRFYEIGSPQGLAELEVRLRSGEDDPAQ
ncbi:MAG: NTP transferase domain-containing protein [Magnetococcales bacterium]|nr:NTP transferase domain-containing protein [Magnetococcales bacterium]